MEYEDDINNVASPTTIISDEPDIDEQRRQRTADWVNNSANNGPDQRDITAVANIRSSEGRNEQLVPQRGGEPDETRGLTDRIEDRSTNLKRGGQLSNPDGVSESFMTDGSSTPRAPSFDGSQASSEQTHEVSGAVSSNPRGQDSFQVPSSDSLSGQMFHDDASGYKSFGMHSEQSQSAELDSVELDDRSRDREARGFD